MSKKSEPTIEQEYSTIFSAQENNRPSQLPLIKSKIRRITGTTPIFVQNLQTDPYNDYFEIIFNPITHNSCNLTHVKLKINPAESTDELMDRIQKEIDILIMIGSLNPKEKDHMMPFG